MLKRCQEKRIKQWGLVCSLNQRTSSYEKLWHVYDMCKGRTHHWRNFMLTYFCSKMTLQRINHFAGRNIIFIGFEHCLPLYLSPLLLPCSKFKQLFFFLLDTLALKRGEEWQEGQKKKGEEREDFQPKQREMTVCLVRAAYYLEHTNLPPLGWLPGTSNRRHGGSLQTDAVV